MKKAGAKVIVIILAFLLTGCTNNHTTESSAETQNKEFVPQGTYRDNMGSELVITENEDGSFAVNFSIYKLAYMDNAVGNYDKETNVFSFEGVDYFGDPLAADVVSDGASLIVTLTKSSYEDMPVGAQLTMNK